MSRASAAWLTVLAVGASACLRQAEDRAVGDLEVGVGSAGGVRFAVADGLAHIRSIAQGEVELRALAPVLQITATPEPGSDATWTLTVHNCMPDAEMSAVSGTAPLAITSLGGPRPTVRAWQVDLPDDADAHLTIAPPDHAQPEPFRVAVMSDIQQGLDEVDEVFARINQTDAVRMVLSTGDLVEDAASEEFDLLEAQLETLNLPFYATVGNHDLWRGAGPWRRRFGRFTVHFDFKGVAFSMVDSGSATIDPIAYDWLDQWLVDAADRTHVFLTHVPPLDPVGVRSGAFRSRREANKLLAKLAAGNVDLTLYGHIHSYYEFANAGIPAYVSGGGGAWPERWDGIGRHFLRVDLAPDRAPSVEVVRVD